jgi:hypothetical protein
MALQPDAETGVVLAECGTRFDEAEGDLASFAGRCGWPLEAVRTIEEYRGVEARYSFPALGQLRDLFVDADFSVADVLWPGYELGDRCPSLVLVPDSHHGGP